MRDENKTKKQLINEMVELRQRVSELEASEIERKRAEEALLKQKHDLGERVKELNCLYGISNLVEREGISLEEIIQGTVDLIPPSWQYPEITCARVMLKSHELKTKNFKETEWKQSSDIVVYGERTGTIEIYYLRKKPESDEGPFLKEERNLIDAISERLGRIAERKRAEKALQESEKRLSEQNILLQEKNIALREVMKQQLEEKKNLETKIFANVDQLLLPLLTKLKNKGSQLDREYISLLEDNLKRLTSSFGSEISRKMLKLTPREIEICNMIRSGLTSKEIARILNISNKSVENHRNNIRKKLGITNKQINLSTYLKSIQS